MILTEHSVGNITLIPVGEGRMLRAGEQLVAVFHLRSGEVRATEPWCPHRGGPLADGLLGAGRVVCPLHNRSFCLDTGAGDDADTTIATYAVRINSAGDIFVSVGDDRP